MHTLDYPRNAPDEPWDGEGEFDEDGECYLSFDELRGGDSDEVLGGIWCNDDTAEVGVGAADARLIAAAPDLLEAALAILEAFGDDVWLGQKAQALDKVMDAINKSDAKSTQAS